MATVLAPAPAVRRVVALTYGFQFFFGLLVWVPVFYSYQRLVGLSDAEILGIQSIYYIVFCLFEIPTGLFADRFDYRWSLGAGAGVLLAANVLPVAEPSYAGFLAHWLLVALARSLVSGAASAYLFEYLRRAGRGDDYQRAEGRGRAYSLVGKIVVWPVAGLLLSWQMTSVYWLTALNAAIALLLVLGLPRLPPEPADEPGDHRPVGPAAPDDRRPPLRDTLTGAFAQLRGSRILVLIMFQGVAIFTLARIGQVNLFQPILESKHVPLAWHGLVMSAMTLFEVFGAARSHRVRAVLGDLRAVFALTALMAGALALVVPVEAALVVACLCVFSLASGLSYPIQRKLLNEAITDSRYRATLLSTESILDRLVCALVALALGGYLAAGRLDAFLGHAALGAGLLMAVLVPLFVLARRVPPSAPARRRTPGGS
ncbi:MFS transporter [Longispora sp. K20-0274]|uniref:MFS transporter n=1 Tax=Longispora sp. K20-0274 TaxID=3088255 RepID=UPI00399AA24B